MNKILQTFYEMRSCFHEADNQFSVDIKRLHEIAQSIDNVIVRNKAYQLFEARFRNYHVGVAGEVIRVGRVRRHGKNWYTTWYSAFCDLARTVYHETPEEAIEFKVLGDVFSKASRTGRLFAIGNDMGYVYQETKKRSEIVEFQIKRINTYLDKRHVTFMTTVDSGLSDWLSYLDDPKGVVHVYLHPLGMELQQDNARSLWLNNWEIWEKWKFPNFPGE